MRLVDASSIWCLRPLNDLATIVAADFWRWAAIDAEGPCREGVPTALKSAPSSTGNRRVGSMRDT